MSIEFTYNLARDLDTAWLNFELDLPLQPLPNGRPNPFYVPRPGNPTAELEDALLAPFHAPPKFFFSGHRGCGKSTELRRLATNPDIQAKYWPVHFSIRDEGDINDLDFRDVLVAIGGQMVRQYMAQGHKLDDQLLVEIEQWRGEVVTETEKILEGRIGGWEVDANLTTFFANLGLKMKSSYLTLFQKR